MIYGPYKRQGRMKPVKAVRQNKQQNQYHYRPKPGKQVVRLRIALVICIIAMAAVSGRLIYLHLTAGYVPDFTDWRMVGTLAAAIAWLLFLLRRAI